MKNNFIKLTNVSKVYLINQLELKIIKNLSLNLQKNCIVSIIGPSGSGKSTLLNILGLLDKDFSGDYEFNSKNIKQLSQSEINLKRGLSIGFIHQFFHLIPELNVIENIMLPYLINHKDSNGYEKAKNLINIFC